MNCLSSFRFGATGCAWLSCMQAVMDIHIVGLTEWSTNGNSTIIANVTSFCPTKFSICSLEAMFVFL